MANCLLDKKMTSSYSIRYADSLARSAGVVAVSEVLLVVLSLALGGTVVFFLACQHFRRRLDELVVRHGQEKAALEAQVRELFASMVDSRVGPVLRQVCDITDEDGPAEVRRKIATWLERQAADLPPDLRIAIMGAFAVDQDARLPLYQDRVGWIATRLDRD